MMVWWIDDFDQYQLKISNWYTTYYVPKFRIKLVIEEPYLYIYYNDRERGDGGDVRKLKIDYRDVADGYGGYLSNPSSAAQLAETIDAYIISGWTNIPATTPGGSDGEVQYNSSGTFAGDPGLIFDDVDTVLSINGSDPMTVNGVAQTTHLEVHGEANSNHSEIEIHRHSNGDGTKIFGARSRGSFPSPSIVQADDVLMNLMAVGYDGTDFATSSEIEFAVDGTPGANDMPGRIVFRTSADGSQSLTERVRIRATGEMRIAGLAGGGNQMVITDNDGDLAVKVLPSYIIASTGTVASTNTTAEEALWNVLIPGGTLAVNDWIEVKLMNRKTSGTGSNTFRVRLNTATGVGGSIISNYAGTSTQTSVQGPLVSITGASAQISTPAFNGTTYAVAAVDTVATAFAIASDIYLNFTNQKVTGTDGFELRTATVIIHKYRT